MRHRFILLTIIFIASLLRFYNLLFDAPYFFNPDERNMANAIVQFRIPDRIPAIPSCLMSQWITPVIESGISLERSIPDDKPHPDNDCNLHPHFFAYGQFPLYLAFFSSELTLRPLSVLLPTTNEVRSSDYSSAIFWLRFWSATASVATVWIIYHLVKDLFTSASKSISVLSYVAALFVAGTPGLIQSAHFGTTESFLSFFLLTSVYLSLRILTHPGMRYVVLLAVCIGCAIGTKLTGLFCFVPPFLVALFQFAQMMKRKHYQLKKISHYLGTWLIFLGIVLLMAVVSSPYNIIDLAAFKGSVFGYERDVATGAYRAFYTRQFEQTIPFLFQMYKVFPYALGWPLYILGSLGFLLISITPFHRLLKLIQEKRAKQLLVDAEEAKPDSPEEPLEPRSPKHQTDYYIAILIIVVTFLAYLIPNALLYAKWTRFMTPIFPFFSLFAVFFIHLLSPHVYSYRHWSLALYLLVLLPGLAFFSIYTRPDVRVTATHWIYQHIPSDNHLLFDTGNVIDIPLGLPDEPSSKPRPSYSLKSFDFYHLDENAELEEELLIHLEKADYIFLPSRRIFANYMRLPKEYPLTTRYYELLFNGSLGFEPVATFTSFPSLGPLSFPDEQAEETSTVFDHPVVRIYKKVKPLNQSAYRTLLQDKR